jgi:hypothetical protein
MRDDYQIRAETQAMTVQVEKTVVEKLQQMEKFSKHSVSELANTALKRFISQHKDFLPPVPRD